jgi:hypothetical protein
MTVAFARAGLAAASPSHEAASETSDETLIGRIQRSRRLFPLQAAAFRGLLISCLPFSPRESRLDLVRVS